MIFPKCQCGAPSSLTGTQTREQFEYGMDKYLCENGHVFEALIPLKIKEGYGLRYAVRADM